MPPIWITHFIVCPARLLCSMLALSVSLQKGRVTADSVTFCDASLEAFGLLSKGVGRMMSVLVQTRRRVWLSHSSLTAASRRTLRVLPVEPGGMFVPSSTGGAAAHRPGWEDQAAACRPSTYARGAPPLPPVPASHHPLTSVGVVVFSVPC